ncbi:MAG TPA: hypothetical protein VIH40_05840 [Xanthobacteraceae bacterium]
MADRKSLSIVGFVFAGMTFAAMMMATVLVTGHVGGRLTLDSEPTIAAIAR